MVASHRLHTHNTRNNQETKGGKVRNSLGGIRERTGNIGNTQGIYTLGTQRIVGITEGTHSKYPEINMGKWGTVQHGAHTGNWEQSKQ